MLVRLILPILVISMTLLSTHAIAEDTTVKKEQYLYTLKLIPSLLDESNWTERENGIVEEHFERLKSLIAEGKLILAGRTLNVDPSGFGIVILEVESEKEARGLMKSDPAVREGIMTAELFPYRVALIRSAEKEVRKVD
jgi:uncharacterized protein YciI